MKTDRLYAITVYLLNHGKTTAKELSEKFEVSVRTIQRDVDSLCLSGIPIVAETGASGGYYLDGSFRMNAQMVSKEDYSFILTALKGFSSAVRDANLDATVEKISALAKEKNDGFILDFSSLREIDPHLFQLLQTAIKRKNPVRFEYTNADNVSRTHTVEPVAVAYRWYAWYLLAYSTVKGDYRTYKLIRMRKAEIVQAPFTKKHGNPEKIFWENAQNDSRQEIVISIRCKKEARAKAIEYLNGQIVSEYENGDCEMKLYVVENEHFWFGSLLALGNGVEVLSPERVKNRVVQAAEKIFSLYKKTMT